VIWQVSPGFEQGFIGVAPEIGQLLVPAKSQACFESVDCFGVCLHWPPSWGCSLLLHAVESVHLREPDGQLFALPGICPARHCASAELGAFNWNSRPTVRLPEDGVHAFAP
jgi:hypothetical protein